MVMCADVTFLDPASSLVARSAKVRVVTVELEVVLGVLEAEPHAARAVMVMRLPAP
jgi:hypothetical protein